MNDKPHTHPPTRPGCRPVRLAETALAAVDVCDCGMMQLHLGAITLRMTPGAVSELLATLGQAVAARAAAAAVSGDLEGDPPPYQLGKRGEA